MQAASGSWQDEGELHKAYKTRKGCEAGISRRKFIKQRCDKIGKLVKECVERAPGLWWIPESAHRGRLGLYQCFEKCGPSSSGTLVVSKGPHCLVTKSQVAETDYSFSRLQSLRFGPQGSMCHWEVVFSTPKLASNWVYTQRNWKQGLKDIFACPFLWDFTVFVVERIIRYVHAVEYYGCQRQGRGGKGRGRPRRARELFSRFRVSVLQQENVPKIGCTTMWMCFNHWTELWKMKTVHFMRPHAFCHNQKLKENIQRFCRPTTSSPQSWNSKSPGN